MALLWKHLPAESRAARRQCPELEWGVEAYLLRLIENELAGLTWGMSDPKKRPPKPPEPVKMPGELAEARAHRDNALRDKEEITRQIGRASCRERV